MSDRVRTSIIIPVYRGADDALECLRSLRETGTFDLARIIIVDDASGDDTAQTIQDAFPDVHLIRRDTNGGFAKAVNTGAASVPVEQDFIALLNSDTVVEAGWMSRAIERLDAEPRLAAIAPKIVRYDRPDLLDSAGHCYTISGWAYRRGHGEAASEYDRPAMVFGATGCALVLRRSALDDPTVLYREDLVCYYEDVELSFRLLKNGWETLYLPDCVVRHKCSASYGKMPAHKAFYVSRNIDLVFWQYLPRCLSGRARIHHGLLVAMQGLHKLLRGQPGPYVKGKLAAWRERRGASPTPLPNDAVHWFERRWLGRAIRGTT